MKLRRALGALEEREFRLLWLGRSLSSIGDALLPVAIAFAILDVGTASDLGFVLGAAMAGRMVFAFVAGVWVDRLPRRTIMLACDLVRGIALALVALAFWSDAVEVWHLAIAFATVGIADAFFNPASTALVPQIVSEQRLQEANALLGLTRNAAMLFGPALAGLLVAVFGYALVFALDAVSFLASLACLALMQPVARARKRAPAFLAEAREGVREILSRPWMRVTLTADVFVNFAIAPYLVLGPLVAKEHLGGASDWGLVLAGSAAGGIAGGMLVMRWKPERPLLAGYAVLVAIPLALLTLVPPLPLPVLMLGAALFALSIVVGNTFWQTMEQQHVPNEVLGRVDSASFMVAVAISPVSYVAVGPAAEWIGVRETLVAAAAIGVASTVGVLLSRSVRELRRLDDADATPSPSPAASGSGGGLLAPAPTAPPP